MLHGSIPPLKLLLFLVDHLGIQSLGHLVDLLHDLSRVVVLFRYSPEGHFGFTMAVENRSLVGLHLHCEKGVDGL